MPAQVVTGCINIVATQIAATALDVDNWAVTVSHKIVYINPAVSAKDVCGTIDFVVINQQYLYQETSVEG